MTYLIDPRFSISENGIRYGVTTNVHPYLHEYMLDHGVNESHRAWCAEKVKSGEPSDEWEEYEEYEDTYVFEDEEIKCELCWLGGAPLLTIFRSNTVVYTNSPCSPCVPNAADLDSGLCEEGEGWKCYGLPPSFNYE